MGQVFSCDTSANLKKEPSTLLSVEGLNYVN